MSKMFDLTGKRAIVTGGGSGIGAAIAKQLSGQGAHVAILDINPDGAQEVVSQIEEQGGSASFHTCDASQSAEVKKAFEAVTQSGSLHILINNAGIAHVGSVSTTTPEDFERVFSVNVQGAFHCLQAAVGCMQAEGGVIINVSSIAAHVGIADRFAYSMSKGALHAMTLSVAKDCLLQNIRCNSIAPARVHTPFVDGFLVKNYPGQEKEMFETLSQSQPIGRMAVPQEIGSLVLYLCSDEASFITGSCFPIDGGFMTLNN